MMTIIIALMMGTLAQARLQQPFNFQAWGFDPDTAGSNPAQFPEVPIPGSKEDVGLALSGGGSRAMMCSRGILQGLRTLGVLNKTKYISSVSGGTWAASIFTYLPPKIDVSGGFGCKTSVLTFCDRDTVNLQAVKDDALLGIYTAPSDLTLAQMNTLEDGSMAYVPSKLGLQVSVYGLLEYLTEFNAPPTSQFWNFLVDRFVLTPGALGTHHKTSLLSPISHFGTNNFRPYTSNTTTRDSIQAHGNTLLSQISLPSNLQFENRFDMIATNAGTDRPYLVMNSALIVDGGVPVADQCKVAGGVLAPFECTSEYCGVPACPKGSCGTFGGGWASNFASRLKMNFKDSAGGTDSLTCPLCKADLGWIGKLFDDNNPTLDSTGDYTGAYSRIRSPTNGGWDHKVIWTDRMVSQLSLKDTVGPSSAAPSYAICQLFAKIPSLRGLVPNIIPSYHYVSASTLLNSSIPASQVKSQRHVFVDGGSLENTGITALLRRRLPSIISLVATATAMTTPSGTADNHPTIDSQVSELFGYSYDKTGKKWVQNSTLIWVFDASRFFELVDGLWAASLTGGAVYLQLSIPVRANPSLGISGPDIASSSYQPNITWVYNQLNEEWLDQTSPDIQAALGKADASWFEDFEGNLTAAVDDVVAYCKNASACPELAQNFTTELQAGLPEIIDFAESGVLVSNFPNYDTILELNLAPIQSNALTYMHSYNVISNAEKFQFLFPSQRSSLQSKSEGPCLPECPQNCTAALNCSCEPCAIPGTRGGHAQPLADPGFRAVISLSCTDISCCNTALQAVVCAGITLQTCECDLGSAIIPCPVTCSLTTGPGTSSNSTTSAASSSNKGLLGLLGLLGIIPLVLCCLLLALLVMGCLKKKNRRAPPVPLGAPVVVAHRAVPVYQTVLGQPQAPPTMSQGFLPMMPLGGMNTPMSHMGASPFSPV